MFEYFAGIIIMACLSLSIYACLSLSLAIAYYSDRPYGYWIQAYHGEFLLFILKLIHSCILANGNKDSAK
ncbi:palmitoyltransferase ZDHHC11 [Schistosoma japonicum]|nr:palmitoyltransferase ZDHHC11 [Schistosoma japonicum]